MSEKHTPEALELAAELEKYRPIPGAGYSMSAAAALLRTQYALLQQARAALSHSNPSEPIWKTPHREAIADITAHLEPKP